MSFSKAVNRRLIRAKESLLEAFGKAPKTKDEEFEHALNEFSNYQTNITKYRKQVKVYLECIKQLKGESQVLMNIIWDLYDPSWPDSDKIQVKGDVLGTLYDNYSCMFKAMVFDPLNKHIEKLQEISSKIAKRDKKRLDLDANKRILERRESTKRKDTFKIEQATKEVSELQRNYRFYNSEVLDDMSRFFDVKNLFIAGNLQSLFGTKETFHQGCFTIFTDLNSSMKTLGRNMMKENLKSPRPLFISRTGRSMSASPVSSSVPFSSADYDERGMNPFVNRSHGASDTVERLVHLSSSQEACSSGTNCGRHSAREDAASPEMTYGELDAALQAATEDDEEEVERDPLDSLQEPPIRVSGSKTPLIENSPTDNGKKCP